MSLPPADLFEIERLIARYCFAVDEGDGEGLAACFSKTGRFLNGDELLAEGHDGLRAFVATLGSRGQMRHITSSILAEGEGETARSRAYCQVYAIDPQRGPYVLSQGVYNDRLRKEAGRWLFEERCYVADCL